MIKIFSEY